VAYIEYSIFKVYLIKIGFTMAYKNYPVFNEFLKTKGLSVKSLLFFSFILFIYIPSIIIHMFLFGEIGIINIRI